MGLFTVTRRMWKLASVRELRDRIKMADRVVERMVVKERRILLL